MVNEIGRVLNTAYEKKIVKALNKVCDYYNDGLYKKIRNKTMDEKYYELFNIRKNNAKKIEINKEEQIIFPRDLINKKFRLLDLEKQNVIELKVVDDKKECKNSNIRTNSPLAHCLVNKSVNDIVLVRSLDNRKSLVTEYKILRIS